MPRSFLVKSQESRDKEKKHGIGIAKLVYDPTRAATVITTLAKPEPRRPVITYAQASLHPQTGWTKSWITPSSVTSTCPMPLQSYVIESKVKENPTIQTVTNQFFRPFLPLPIPSRQSYVTAGRLSAGMTSFASDEEGRLSSPGSDCGETYQEKKGFNRRMTSRKSGQKLKCADCGKEYCTAGGLSKHQQTQCRARQNGRTFQCKYCPKEYTALGALKMHLRTHTLPCKCGLCGKAFSRPWLLQGHIRTHTGEKPFSCPHCQRAFADRSNLRAHLQTHTQIKRYSCSICSRTFSRMSLLNKHTKSGCDRMKGSFQPLAQTEGITAITQ